MKLFSFKKKQGEGFTFFVVCATQQRALELVESHCVLNYPEIFRPNLNDYQISETPVNSNKESIVQNSQDDLT